MRAATWRFINKLGWILWVCQRAVNARGADCDPSGFLPGSQPVLNMMTITA